MLGLAFVFGLFAWLIIEGLRRPWVGIIGFYGWIILEPEWNWRWSVPQDFRFQQYLAASVLLGWLLNGCRIQRLSPVARNACIALVLFLCLAFISNQQSIAPELSNFYMGNMWKIVLMAILAVFLLDTPAKIWTALTVIAIAQGYSAFRINEQYFQDGFSLFAYRPWGTKGDNNLYSNLTVPLAACSLAITFNAKDKRLKYVMLFIAIVQIHQIMLLQSRGAMIAGILTATISAWMMPRTKWNLRMVGLLAFFSFALAGPSVVKEFSSAFAKEGDRDSSAESRLILWRAGWEITQDYPLLGVGPYAGQKLVPQYAEGISSQNKGLHNLFFEISTGCGVPATICYMYFLLASLIFFYRKPNRGAVVDYRISAVRHALIPGLIGYLVASMFSSGALSESSYALSAIGLAASSVVSRPNRVANYVETKETLNPVLEGQI